MDAVPPGPPPGPPRRQLPGGLRQPPGRGRGMGPRRAKTSTVSALATSIGTNYRISGAQSSARSESDIRINYWNPNQIIGASNNISGSGFQAQFYSLDGGTTWGQTTLPAYSTRRLQLRPDRRLDLRRHGVVLDDGDQQRRHRPHGPDVQVDGPGADLDVRRDDLRHPDEHRQADGLGRPQRHLALQGQHLRHLAQRQPGLHEPAERDRLALLADPGERKPRRPGPASAPT